MSTPFWYDDLSAVTLIACQLSLKDFGRFLKVCRFFQTLSKNNFVWRKIHRNEFVLFNREVLMNTSRMNDLWYDQASEAEEPYEEAEILNWMCGHVSVEKTFDAVIRCKACDASDHSNWKEVLQEACLARKLGKLAGGAKTTIPYIYSNFQALDTCSPFFGRQGTEIRPFFVRAHAGRTGVQRLVDAFACARLTEESALVEQMIRHHDVDGKVFFGIEKATEEKSKSSTFHANAKGVKRYMKERLENLRFRMVCFGGDKVDCGMIFGSSLERSVIGLHYFWN